MTSEVHHRHHPVHEAPPPPQRRGESAPLLHKQHLSMDDQGGSFYDTLHQHTDTIRTTFRLLSAFCAIVILIASIYMAFPRAATKGGSSSSAPSTSEEKHTPTIVPIEAAHEQWVRVDENDMKVWYRTWGNHETGIPLLFVHGGPGNAIADYHNGNKEFFSDQYFFVVEVDQRGTGNSQPSVRESWRNMRYYQDISIDVIVADFEIVRENLDIEQWIVWGGSFGSTLSINYASRYPERCLALILRGIYLDTPAEVHAVYAREPYVKNPKRLAEFEILFDYAQDHELEELDPNDAERLLRVYANLIESGDKHAIWHWHVFENNLMETERENLLDPNVIDRNVFPEAQSVAFFETRLWLRGSYESPSNLLQRIDQLLGFPIWICQGQFDEVCPPENAQKLANALEQVGAEYTMRSIPSGHEQTDPIMAKCLAKSLREYVEDNHPWS